MYDFKKIFERADIQKIRNFLLYGQEDIGDFSSQSYEQRIENASSPAYKLVAEIFPDETSKEYDRAYLAVADAITDNQYIFLEIGMKIGVKLAYQLMQEENKELKLDKE